MIPIDLPPEAMANQEIANLWSEYQLTLNEFKEVHKGHADSRKESDQFKQLKNDISIIETEKENGKNTIVIIFRYWLLFHILWCCLSICFCLFFPSNFELLFQVKKRLERTQSRLDKVPQQDLLLEAGHALRVERDRQKELQSQLESQRQSVQKANVVCFRQTV